MVDRTDIQGAADSATASVPTLTPTSGAEAAPAPQADAYVAGGDALPILRFLTCGSVDDGKSTLIGRLLYDTNLVQEDALAALETESKAFGTTGGDLDFALLVDGLQAERQQGITIDVAYRYFRTPKRKFIVADTPGHEQYTRNMVTGSSRCDLAIILVDARYGILPQTRRHSFITSLLGIRHVVVAVNKMDLVDYGQARFEEIEADYRAFAEELSFETVTPIPVSALAGENLTRKSDQMPWYTGPSLLGCLEQADVGTAPRSNDDMRLPVQWVCRPDRDFR
ncbi:MAG: GTP-binding protein, partial [Pseudomonadota bacterium]